MTNISDISDINLKTHWLTVDQDGNLGTQKKLNFLGWLVKILTGKAVDLKKTCSAERLGPAVAKMATKGNEEFFKHFEVYVDKNEHRKLQDEYNLSLPALPVADYSAILNSPKRRPSVEKLPPNIIASVDSVKRAAILEKKEQEAASALAPLFKTVAPKTDAEQKIAAVEEHFNAVEIYIGKALKDARVTNGGVPGQILDSYITKYERALVALFKRVEKTLPSHETHAAAAFNQLSRKMEIEAFNEGLQALYMEAKRFVNQEVATLLQ